uniref:Uncharacterized protein n=1 Tax=viral metagenome TaxID=1070528 RepID=A0A6C0EEF3_9ZZZZ
MNSNDEYVNQITLKYLTSIDYQNDVHGVSVSDPHNKGDKINKSKQTGSKIYRQKDKKFYKKRISNIIKLLLNDGVEDDTNQPNYPLFPDIKNTFDIFIRTCIDYLKSQDKCDIIQNDYNNFTNVTNSDANVTSEPTSDIINNNEMNALMMRKIASKKNSIDSFVKRTSTRQTATIIPHKKKINLQDPELKTKGLVLGGGTVAKPPKIDTPPPKDKKICENKNNNIYKETIPKLDILSKNDNQEEKTSNEKDSEQKKHKKDKKQKNKKNTLQLFIENNE